jgi:hypothetical protein
VLFYVLFVLCRSVLCVYKCVLYNCHRVATHLQLTNISYIRYVSHDSSQFLFSNPWSRGSVLASNTQVRGFKSGRSRRNFKGEKIHSTLSFGGEVRPSVACRIFAACKRSLNGVEVVISAKLPDEILAHSSTFRRWDLSRRGGRGGTWWRKVERLNAGKAMANYP